MHTLSQRWGCLISRVEALAAEAEPVPGEGELRRGHCSFADAVHRVIKKKGHGFANVVEQAVAASKNKKANS